MVVIHLVVFLDRAGGGGSAVDKNKYDFCTHNPDIKHVVGFRGGFYIILKSR